MARQEKSKHKRTDTFGFSTLISPKCSRPTTPEASGATGEDQVSLDWGTDADEEEYASFTLKTLNADDLTAWDRNLSDPRAGGFNNVLVSSHMSVNSSLYTINLSALDIL